SAGADWERVMNETQRGSSTVANDADREKPPGIFSMHGVRYQVTDVARAAAFYTDRLGFRLERRQLPAFASVIDGQSLMTHETHHVGGGILVRQQAQSTPFGRARSKPLRPDRISDSYRRRR